MQIKKFWLVGFIVTISAVQSFATYSRVESMGKNSKFIMDDISIFDNPANINIYPNYLIGEFGAFTDDIGPGNNIDPQNPWFGGIFSLALGKEDSRDPRFSIGGALNRKDELLYGLLPDSVKQIDQFNVLQTIAVPDPAVKFDGFLGLTTPKGNMIGSHIYIGHQQGAQNAQNGYKVDADAFASIVRVDVGINWGLSHNVDAEFSVGGARVQFGPMDQSLWKSELMSVIANGRIFSTIEAINGELVITGSGYHIQTTGLEKNQFLAGPGVNVALDRGFFWLGVEGFWNQIQSDHWNLDATTGESYYFFEGNSAQRNPETMDEKGGKISFGIERNLWSDWFVIRVGGQKVMSYRDCNANENNLMVDAAGVKRVPMSVYCQDDGSYWYTNPTGDRSMSDHVGFGIGINVEEKLKVDATVAEDVLFRNPFQGSGRIFSRISATYSF